VLETLTFHSVFGNEELQYAMEGDTAVFPYNINLAELGLTNIEWFPPKARVEGNFNCAWNKLEDFSSFPKELEVTGFFSCSVNKLKTLDDLPQVFSCGDFFGNGNPDLPKDTPKPKGVNGRFVIG